MSIEILSETLYVFSMARTPRSQLQPGWYHCINRGVNRQLIFLDHNDYSGFMNKLLDLSQKSDLRLGAFCLMPNHWHVVIDCSDVGKMSSMFKNLLNWHTRVFHMKYQSIEQGPIYQGRYKSIPIPDDTALNEVCGYVELNPVRAELVKSLGEWRWATYMGTVR
jgi:putative transposase